MSKLILDSPDGGPFDAALQAAFDGDPLAAYQHALCLLLGASGELDYSLSRVVGDVAFAGEAIENLPTDTPIDDFFAAVAARTRKDSSR